MLKEKKIIVALIVSIFVIIFVIAMTTGHSEKTEIVETKELASGVHDHEEQVCRELNGYTDYEIQNSCDARYELV